MYKQEDELRTFKDIQSFLGELGSNWVFRGQCNYDWDLKTSLDRLQMISPLKDPVKKSNIEHLMIDEVKRDIHMFAPNMKELINNNMQIISFLQHYGAPTRFLDFTTSYLAALFFAVESSSTDSAIYAINKNFINMANCVFWDNATFEGKFEKNSIYIDGKRYHVQRIPSILRNYRYNFSSPRLFDAFIKDFPEPQKFVAIIKPYHSFDRITSQSGLFLCSGNTEMTFVDNLNESMKRHPVNYTVIYKIKIPVRLKTEILSHLYRQNISSASLYGGAEGFAKSLSLKVMTNIYDTIGNSL